MVELRKRKAPAEPAPPPSKKTNPVKAAASKLKGAVTGGSSQKTAATNGESATPANIAVGDTLTLTDSFGGEIETNAGEKTTLKKLVDASAGGVVIFTYPRASTPGCTSQACLFRDAYSHLTSTGYAIYGLSTDSPKSNTTFQTKQNLPYTLLCDPHATLIGAIGMKKAPKGTVRGVFVVGKDGKVLANDHGGPQATVDVVAELIKKSPSLVASEETKKLAKEDNVELAKTGEVPVVEEGTLEQVKSAETAAEVADTAAKVDGDATE